MAKVNCHDKNYVKLLLCHCMHGFFSVHLYQYLCHAEGEDYVVQNGAFGAGSAPEQSVSLLIQFLNDDIVEPLENLTVGVSTQPIARLIFSDSPGLDVIEGTIIDDD